MPGTRCSVVTCNNSLIKTKRENLDISYHKFPKNKMIREAWITACHRTGDWNPDTSAICSIHFTEQDIERDLKSELLKIKTKRRLKSTAIPRLFLLKDDSQDFYSEDILVKSHLYQNGFNTLISTEEELNNPSISNCSEIVIKDETLIKEKEEPLKMECVYLEESLTESYENEQLPNLLLTEEQLHDSDISKMKSTVKYKMISKEKAREKDTLEMKYNKLRDSYKEQKKKIRQLKMKLSQTTKKFRREYINKRKMQAALNSIFSKAQQDIIVNKKKKIVWDGEDISKAFTLWCLSKGCYIYIRNRLKYPLPHAKTLAKWAAKLKRKEPIPLEDLNEDIEHECHEENIVEYV